MALLQGLRFMFVFVGPSMGSAVRVSIQLTAVPSSLAAACLFVPGLLKWSQVWLREHFPEPDRSSADGAADQPHNA